MTVQRTVTLVDSAGDPISGENPLATSATVEFPEGALEVTGDVTASITGTPTVSLGSATVPVSLSDSVTVIGVVDIGNTPTVSLGSETPTVTLGSETVTVTVNGTSTVTLGSETVSVTIVASEDTITIEGDVGITGTPTVSLGSATVPVSIAGTPTISVTGAVTAYGNSVLISVTPGCDTGGTNSGDLLFEQATITGAMRINGGTGILQSLTLLDKDDQGVEMDLYVYSDSVDFGTLDSAPSISDSDAEKILCQINVASTDWKDLGGCRVATKSGLGIVVGSATATTNLWVAGVVQGNSTFTASGLVLTFGFLRD